MSVYKSTNRTGQIVTALGILIVLAACGSSTPVRYYALSVAESNYQGAMEGSRELGIGPIRIPRYLSRSRIVIRGSNSEMIVGTTAISARKPAPT